MQENHATTDTDDTVGIKNISQIKQSLTISGNRMCVVSPGQGIVVTKKEFEKKYKDQRTPNREQVWKIVPKENLIIPDGLKLKSIKDDDNSEVDKDFVKSFNALAEIGVGIDDIIKHINGCHSKKTLEVCISDTKDMNIEKDAKKEIMTAIIGRIQEVK